jgi:hypothetical protein
MATIYLVTIDLVTIDLATTNLPALAWGEENGR